MKDELHYQSIETLSKLLHQQEISPVDVVKSCLDRIEQLNPKLNAFITVLSDEAMEQAKIAEEEIKAGKYLGPLHGIPVTLKDFYDTAGVKTTAAFEHFKDRVPDKDAAVVSKLKDAGSIIIGKTNMHTLGMGTTGLESYFGPTKNPWNADFIPGGSSSGSAVAIATGMSYATVDTDAIGSCRLPAACCGVVGFKGTYGLIDLKGILEGEQPPDQFIIWMSHVGITTRDVADTALMVDALMTKGKLHFSSDTEKSLQLRVGVANNFKSDKEISAAFKSAIDKLHNIGYSTTDVSVPFGGPDQGIDNIEVDRASVEQKIFDDIDALVLPTTATITPTVEASEGNSTALLPDNTAFANYYGLPAISVPCGFDSHGLPLGLQIVGKPGHEVDVLQIAKAYQDATKNHIKHP